MTAADDHKAEARQLVAAYPTDVFTPPPQDWTPGMVTGQVPDATDEDGYADVWITADAFAAHVMRTLASPLLAALADDLDTAQARIQQLERELLQFTVDERCNCGWGGVHDPDNPRCNRNIFIAALLASDTGGPS